MHLNTIKLCNKVKSNMVYKLLRTNFQKQKEFFVDNILMYNNLSLFCNNYYGLGDANASLKDCFPEISCFSHLFVEDSVTKQRWIFGNWKMFASQDSRIQKPISLFTQVSAVGIYTLIMFNLFFSCAMSCLSHLFAKNIVYN